MSMDFTPANPWAPLTSSSNVVATLLGIPGVSLPIQKIQQHIVLVVSISRYSGAQFSGIRHEREIYVAKYPRSLFI